jgi:hypothetical protein
MPSDPKEFLGGVAPTKLEEGPRMPHKLKVERGERYASYNLDLAPIGSEPSNVGVAHFVSMDPISHNVHRVGSAQGHFLQDAADPNMSRMFTQPLHAVETGNLVQAQARSRVMKRSAHVTYRRRGYSLEITVQPGVSTHELDLLLGKLGAHRISTTDSHVSLVGPKRRSLAARKAGLQVGSAHLGLLARLDLDKFRRKLEILLETGWVRIVIVDKHKGILQKPSGYSRVMEDAMRRQQLVI